jgi:hypothetical protein
MHAAEAGRQDNIDYLLAKGADASRKSTEGYSACDYARMKKREKINLPGCVINQEPVRE